MNISRILFRRATNTPGSNRQQQTALLITLSSLTIVRLYDFF